MLRIPVPQQNFWNGIWLNLFQLTDAAQLVHDAVQPASKPAPI